MKPKRQGTILEYLTKYWSRPYTAVLFAQIFSFQLLQVMTFTYSRGDLIENQLCQQWRELWVTSLQGSRMIYFIFNMILIDVLGVGRR
jgi:hypothetical protein